MKKLSWLLVSISLLCFAFSGMQLWEHYNPSPLSFSNLPVYNQTANSVLTPIKIVIDSQHITLPIFPATIENNVWSVTDKGASFLTDSAIPGEVGNSIIYGHNFTRIFGRLVNVKPGEKIKVTLNNNLTKTFIVKSTIVVDPTNSSVLQPTKTPTLTIYTCTGFLDSRRFVVRAIPSI